MRFVGDERPRTPAVGSIRDPVHERIIVIGIVVEQDRPADARRIGEAKGLLPGRMAPADKPRILLIREHGIIHHDVGTANEIDDHRVRPVRPMLGVGDDADALAPDIDAVAAGEVRVVEPAGVELDAREGLHRHAAVEIMVLAILEDADRHREQRRHHRLAQHRVDRFVLRFQVTRPESHLAALDVGRLEERHAADMVPMGVGEEDVDIRPPLFHQPVAEVTQAGAAIDDQQVVAPPDLNAAGVAAIAHVRGRRAGDAPAYAPEPEHQIAILRHRRVSLALGAREHLRHVRGRRRGELSRTDSCKSRKKVFSTSLR